MGDFWDDIKKKNEERRIAGIKKRYSCIGRTDKRI